MPSVSRIFRKSAKRNDDSDLDSVEVLLPPGARKYSTRLQRIVEEYRVQTVKIRPLPYFKRTSEAVSFRWIQGIPNVNQDSVVASVDPIRSG